VSVLELYRHAFQCDWCFLVEKMIGSKGCNQSLLPKKKKRYSLFLLKATAVRATVGSFAYDLRSDTRNVVAFGNQAAKTSPINVAQGANIEWHGTTEQCTMDGAGSHQTQVAHILRECARKAIGWVEESKNGIVSRLSLQDCIHSRVRSTLHTYHVAEETRDSEGLPFDLRFLSIDCYSDQAAPNP
jgi:hypothetical protein